MGGVFGDEAAVVAIAFTFNGRGDEARDFGGLGGGLRGAESGGGTGGGDFDRHGGAEDFGDGVCDGDGVVGLDPELVDGVFDLNAEAAIEFISEGATEPAFEVIETETGLQQVADGIPSGEGKRGCVFC